MPENSDTVTATDSDGNSATLPVTVAKLPPSMRSLWSILLAGLVISGISVAHYEENRRWTPWVPTMADGPMAGQGYLVPGGRRRRRLHAGPRDGVLQFRSSHRNGYGD